jgi:hypothetical protein
MSDAHELAARYLAELDDRYHADLDAVRDRAARARDGITHGAFTLRDTLESFAPAAHGGRPDSFAYVNPMDGEAADGAFAYDAIPDSPLAPATDMYHSAYSASADSDAYDTDGIPIRRDS